MNKSRKEVYSGWSYRRPLALLTVSIAAVSLTSGLADPLVGDSNAVAVTSPPQNKIIATVPLGSTGTMPAGAAVSNDNSTVYVCNSESNDVVVIDAATNKVTGSIRIPGDGNPVRCVLTPDGQTLYVANTGTYQITAVSTANKSVTATITPPAGVADLAMAPSGKQVYATSYNNNINVIDVGSTTISKTLPLGSASAQLVFTPDGKQADILCLEILNDNEVGNRFLSTIETGTGKVVKTNGAAGRLIYPSSIAMDPSGTALFVVDQINYVTVVDPVSCKVKRAFLVAPSDSMNLYAGQPAVTLNGNYLYVPYDYTLDPGNNLTWQNQVAMFDVATGKIVGSPITVGKGPNFCTIAPNGKTLYVSNGADGTVTVIDIAP